MIPTQFDYQRATSIDDALARLAAADGGKFIAGGHSLVPAMKLRLSTPSVLIDVARIPGLAGITERDGKIVIGAGTTHREVAASSLLQRACPVVSDTAAEIGDPQVRNRGTIGGNLAHADPAADYPAAMLAVDAEIHAKGPKGWRVIKAADFCTGLFTVDLAPDELLVSVQFRPIRAAAYAKLHQRASHFAIVGVAAALDVKSGVIQSARVGVTGAATHASRLTAVEKALAGKPATTASLEAAAALAAVDEPASDIHASSAYRTAMIPVFTRRALGAALARV